MVDAAAGGIGNKEYGLLLGLLDTIVWKLELGLISFGDGEEEAAEDIDDDGEVVEVESAAAAAAAAAAAEPFSMDAGFV